MYSSCEKSSCKVPSASPTHVLKVSYYRCAHVLQTPYLPFWRLEAAVCPGPVKAGVPAVPGYGEPGSGKGTEVPVEATRKSKRTREDELEEVHSAFLF